MNDLAGDLGGHPDAPLIAMWRAVVVNAYRDLKSPELSVSAYLVRRDAARFLCDEDGVWKRRREEIADLIGSDAERIRHHALPLLREQMAKGLMVRPRVDPKAEAAKARATRRKAREKSVTDMAA